MRIRWLALIVAAGALVAFGAVAGACTSSGGALTLEEYFQELDDLDNQTTENFDAIDTELGDDPSLEQVQDAFPRYLDIFNDFIGDLEDLNPPDEVQDAHDEAVEAGQAFREELSTFVDQAADAETLEELFASAENEAFDTADQRFTDACLALEGIAGDNSITVDLDCEE
jgi:hypothetical protein